MDSALAGPCGKMRFQRSRFEMVIRSRGPRSDVVVALAPLILTSCPQALDCPMRTLMHAVDCNRGYRFGWLWGFAASFLLPTCPLLECCAECPGDITSNGQVNGSDLAIVLAGWGTDGMAEPGSDINQDSIVDGMDLAVVIGAWGPCAIVPEWAVAIELEPDPSVVSDPTLRQAITDTRLAWRVLDAETQIEFLLIPPGRFRMGCSPSLSGPCAPDEGPAHDVVLSQPFYLGRFEVTQSQWTEVMGTNPSTYQAASEQVPIDDVPRRPVERVSWENARDFLVATGMRFPSEAEWEYAYRAGTTSAFHGFEGHPAGTNDDSLAASIAWICSNGCTQTLPVGRRSGNGFGLHDMAGNVWEFVNDWYAPSYGSNEPVLDPTGPAAGLERIVRGGAFVFNASSCRASVRWKGTPNRTAPFVGFRAARTP